MRRFVNKRNLPFAAAGVGIVVIVIVGAILGGDRGVAIVGAILAGLAIIAPFVSQAAADSPRIRAEFIHSMRSDAIVIMLRNTGTGPGYLREIALEISSEQDYTYTVRYNIEEITLYPRQRVNLALSETDSAGRMINMGFRKIILTFRAMVYSEHGKAIAPIVMILPENRAPRTVTESLRMDDGFWRDEKEQMWRL